MKYYLITFAILLMSSQALSSNLSFDGFVEFENITNIYSDEDSAYEDTEYEDSFPANKNELRTHLNSKYEKNRIHFHASQDLYLMTSLFENEVSSKYVYNDEFDVTRNLTLTSKNVELISNELYIGYSGDIFRVRLGNQVFHWGSANTYSPTSYFNPYDTREFLVRSEDEIFMGIPSLSILAANVDSAFEFVFAPIPVTSRNALNTSFWSVDIDNYLLPVVVKDAKEMAIEPENFGYGLRVSDHSGPLETALSFFHGPDNLQLYVPTQTEIVKDDLGNNETVVVLEPQNFIVNTIGADFNLTFDDLSFQGELAYILNKSGVKIDEDITETELPAPVEQSKFYATAIGFNYVLPFYYKEHDHQFLLFSEYYNGQYEDKTLLSLPLSNILTSGLRLNLLDDRLKTDLAFINDFNSKGEMISLKLSYLFLNGLQIQMDYNHFDGVVKQENELASVFYYMRKKII